ncbi:MAG: DUF4861 family protein [Vicinamibacterales bacterium]|nr:DUF4861 family protein [Vicinamibacterales bacterium]
MTGLLVRTGLVVAIGGLGLGAAVLAQDRAWYTQGDFAPTRRLVFELKNDLDIDRVNVPVVIRRDQMPVADLHELQVTVVDPSLPPAPEPDEARLKLAGGHELRGEANGHILLQQMDDLDKDGVWDELFFVMDIGRKATKRIEIYLGMNQRGWNPHETHAAIGSYMRHLVPFWESKHIGWKLWFPTSVDVYGKRKPMLIANRLYMENLDGYGVTILDPAMGSDIQSVESSFGAGGIGVFESPESPATVSVPRYTPARTAAGIRLNFNAGQISDTRYAYDVVVNGPVRSMVRVKTMNWNSGQGSYEVEQLYTAYASQNYSTCHVRFTRWLPLKAGARPGAGIRKKTGENHYLQRDGVVITASPEASDPETGQSFLDIQMVGSALIVPGEFRPEYQFVNDYLGNHTFRVTPRADGTYEYLIAGAWSEGAVLKTWDTFQQYVLQTALEYESPLRIRFVADQAR